MAAAPETSAFDSSKIVLDRIRPLRGGWGPTWSSFSAPAASSACFEAIFLENRPEMASRKRLGPRTECLP
jgi:hypothetical protein